MPHYKRTYKKSPMPITNSCAANSGLIVTSLKGEDMEVYKVNVKNPDSYQIEVLDSNFQSFGFAFIGEEEILSLEAINPFLGSKDGGDSFTLIGTLLSNVDKIEWIDDSDPENPVIIDEPSFTVDNDNQITINAAAPKPANIYRLKIYEGEEYDQSMPVILIT